LAAKVAKRPDQIIVILFQNCIFAKELRNDRMLKEIRRPLLILFFFCFSYFFAGSSYAQDSTLSRNVILFIGDGMGLSHVYAAYTVNKGNLNMMKFPFTGFSKTFSASDYITDSGAGATAISCGKKTYNGAIGMDRDSLPCRTVLEYAEENGLATGLIATSSITHATPASFIAHQKRRERYEDIALDFLKTDIDVFIGGGGHYFASRSDGADLVSQLRTKGYDVFLYPSSINLENSAKAAVFTAPVNNPRISEGRGNMLPDATEKAIDLLSKNKKGFFLMVEGSQIDWGSHENNIGYVTEELTDMDMAVGKALSFAEKNGNTLIVVTADHETGGLTILNGDMKAGTVEVRFTTNSHTGTMVPVFAFGPGAEIFSGVYENTSLFYKIMSFLNLMDPCAPLAQ
jgi:alkaline phosphatase